LKHIIPNYKALTELFRSIDGHWVKTNREQVLEIEVKPYEEKKRLSQNGLFHVWVKEITRMMNKRSEVTFNEDFVKIDLKIRFGVIELGNNLDGTERAYPKSLSKYTKPELNELLTKIHVWATDLQIPLFTRACKEFDEYKEAAQ